MLFGEPLGVGVCMCVCGGGAGGVDSLSLVDTWILEETLGGIPPQTQFFLNFGGELPPMVKSLNTPTITNVITFYCCQYCA